MRDPLTKFAELVKERRCAMQLSQGQVARLVDVTRPTIIAIEQGASTSFATACRLATELKFSLDEVLKCCFEEDTPCT